MDAEILYLTNIFIIFHYLDVFPQLLSSEYFNFNVPPFSSMIISKSYFPIKLTWVEILFNNTAM